MTHEQTIFCLFVVWATGGLLAIIFDASGCVNRIAAEYIWWPLLLVKATIKGLWSVLFTNWKVKP